MAKSDVYLVVMAGGSGTRFWPKSTSKRPKQFLSFGDGNPSLLSQTFSRFDGLVSKDRRWVLTTQALSGAVKDQVPGATILAEPQGRNTAPCIYWAAREIAARDPKAVMAIMPSDHDIPRLEDFKRTVGAAIEWAASHDDLVTLGVAPSRPETGYGYLRTGKGISGDCKKVEAFVEKPNLDKAKEFVASGNYLWNGGMFVWRAEVIIAAFDRHMPEMKKTWESFGGDALAAYSSLTATSIDFGVMEKAPNVVTFPLDCGWDDLGSWVSLENLADRLRARREGGVVTGGELLAVRSSGNIVDAPGKLVALLGVSDLIVVQQGETLLVARKDQAQDIKLIVEEVKKRRPELA